MYADQNKPDLRVMWLRPGVIKLAMTQRGYDARHHRAPALMSWNGAATHCRCVRRSSGLLAVAVEWHYQERLVLFTLVVDRGGMDYVLSPPHLAGDVEQAGPAQPVLPTKLSITFDSAAGLQWPCAQRNQ